MALFVVYMLKNSNPSRPSKHWLDQVVDQHAHTMVRENECFMYIVNIRSGNLPWTCILNKLACHTHTHTRFRTLFSLGLCSFSVHYISLSFKCTSRQLRLKVKEPDWESRLCNLAGKTSLQVTSSSWINFHSHTRARTHSTEHQMHWSKGQ